MKPSNTFKLTKQISPEGSRLPFSAGGNAGCGLMWCLIELLTKPVGKVSTKNRKLSVLFFVLFKNKKTRPRLSNSDTAIAASANVMGSSFPFFMQQPLNNNKYKADSILELAVNELEQFQMWVQVQEALLSPKGNLFYCQQRTRQKDTRQQ